LPVQQATKVELIINLRAAKALGPNIPLPLPGRADLAKANRPNECDAQRQLRSKYRTPLSVWVDLFRRRVTPSRQCRSCEGKCPGNAAVSV
jgi:hypothetical protein